MEQEGRPLSPDELRHLRQLVVALEKIIENEARASWLWGLLKTWLGYTATGIITGYGVWHATTNWIPEIKKYFS